MRGGSSQRTSRCATSPSTRSPSRSAGASRSTRSAALADLSAGRLRMAGPARVRGRPAAGAAARASRGGARAGAPTPTRRARAARAAPAPCADVSAERIFVRAAPDHRRRPRGAPGLEHARRARRRTAVVLPELEALRGVEQNRYHHLDVYGHTLEVLDADDRRSPADPGPFAERPAARPAASTRRERHGASLAEPLADEMTRGEALRWGALLHDAAKPLTRGGLVRRLAGSRSSGHDVRGAELARDVLGAPAGERAPARARRGAGAQPPAPRLPRARAPAALAPHRLPLPARPARPSRWTSRCCRSPTALPPAAIAPRTRSPRT